MRSTYAVRLHELDLGVRQHGLQDRIIEFGRHSVDEAAREDVEDVDAVIEPTVAVSSALVAA